jgi:hypothetical protein
MTIAALVIGLLAVGTLLAWIVDRLGGFKM